MKYIPSNELNELHSKNPQRGDYWHERLNPVLIVMRVTEYDVFVCENIKRTNEGWYWDFTKCKQYSRIDFERLCWYDSGRGFYADVWPKSQRKTI